METFVGIDLGSTTGKIVVLRDGGNGLDRSYEAVVPVSYNPGQTVDLVLNAAEKDGGLDRAAVAGVCVTGYGRNNVTSIADQMSEISCHAYGAHWLDNEVRTLVDIGGQDVKAISVSSSGTVSNFVMNDKCAAGTGRFLEVMARTLHCGIEEMEALAKEAPAPLAISSQCSVFAESEVITYLNQGQSRENVAAGVYDSIGRRVLSMIQRVGCKPKMMMSGGCAKSSYLGDLIARLAGCPVVRIPADPQIIGALGAALYAAEHRVGFGGQER